MHMHVLTYFIALCKRKFVENAPNQQSRLQLEVQQKNFKVTKMIEVWITVDYYMIQLSFNINRD